MATNDIPPTLANMHHFHEILDYEFSRAARYKSDVALIFIKIDRLDEVGRLYGRLAARRLLRKVERLIRVNIRRADREFNYENDELMIILPNTPLGGANSMVPKLTQLIESCRFSGREGTQIALAPKFSIASYDHDTLAKRHAIRLVGNGS